ncbi:MAG: hypothetical protein DME76_14725 [Verrucomicrobia bacterium]|nr:MAG: hypothetical protein DME76_14725 [Verrucomicrobiota bacterium]
MKRTETSVDWQDPDMFEAGNHGNKPFGIRVPSLVVTRGAKNRLNFLTAMWFTPTGFEPSRMIVAIQKRTLTYDFLLERGEFVMSAPTDKMMDIVVFAGYISGRDVDKWQAAGLTAVKPAKISVPLIGEAIGNVEYRVVQQIPFGEEMDLFVGEVLATHVRKGAVEGELYREDSNPLLYMGTKYSPDGKPLGKFYTHMSTVERANYESPLLRKYLPQPNKE